MLHEVAVYAALFIGIVVVGMFSHDMDRRFVAAERLSCGSAAAQDRNDERRFVTCPEVK